MVYFTVQDGSVRQHDLRTSHSCGAESCPAPLVDIGHELSALSLSPLVPYQFVVAGEGPYVRPYVAYNEVFSDE